MVNPHKWQHLHHQHNSTPFSLKALLSSILCLISLVSNDVKWPKKKTWTTYIFNTPLKKIHTRYESCRLYTIAPCKHRHALNSWITIIKIILKKNLKPLKRDPYLALFLLLLLETEQHFFFWKPDSISQPEWRRCFYIRFIIGEEFTIIIVFRLN